MTDKELIDLINSLSEEQVSEIESIDTVSETDAITVIAIGGIKRLEFKMTASGDFSYKYLGVKLKRFS
jgi:hypothetical protein